MRLTFMSRTLPMSCTLPTRRTLIARLGLGIGLAFALCALPAATYAQAVAGPAGNADTYKDTSMLKVPSGAKVAIYEFEDLECPACAHAFPIVHTAVEHYKIPLLRHDFPLSMHVWSRDAAITARYLQDKVSEKVAEEYRRDVFANQSSIGSKDDLQNFTRKWFGAKGQQVPFVMDPTGRFAAEVQADYTLGERLGLMHTPTILVLAPNGYTQITDVTQLYTVIDRGLAESSKATTASAAVHNNLRKPKTAQK